MFFVLKGEPKPIQFLKKVGPERAKAFEKEQIKTDIDLIYYFPRTYVNRTSILQLKQVYAKLLSDNYTFVNERLTIKEEVTTIGKVTKISSSRSINRRNVLFVEIVDFSGYKAKIIFWQYGEYYSKLINYGNYIIVRGTPDINRYRIIIFNQPEIEVLDSIEQHEFQKGTTLPIYPLPIAFRKSKINNKLLRSIISNTIDETINKLEDYIPEEILTKLNIPELRSAIKNIHFPESLEIIPSVQNRFKFDEAFIFEILLALSQKIHKSRNQAPVFQKPIKDGLVHQFKSSLPFELTQDQKKVINEIFSDLQSGKAMNRLLQGDVGSGKTIVALFAMLYSCENGYQSLIMAPTEILAEQHFLTLKNLLNGLDIKIELVTGSQSQATRRKIQTNIANGSTNIIIGTHALFEEKMKYHKLALIIIDEQHRFGVAQRAKLKELAENSLYYNLSPHLLVMSATPIPRTLAMTLYGDLDVSIIKQMPSGRKPIVTKIVFESEFPQLIDLVKSELNKGRQAYFVYPLVEKSEKLDLKSATEHFNILQTKYFPEYKCGLLHGQMKWEEKERMMKYFKNKLFHILVSTTVIEVGIDVPNATIIVIENAERFGLSQLHQLRGRVGRGEFQSYCFLVTKDKYNTALTRKIFPTNEDKSTIARLKAMEQTTDGFLIAEYDLQIRGPGDLAGTQQSGLPPFKYLSLVSDGKIIEKAKEIAVGLLSKDPNLDNYPKIKIVLNKYSELKKYWGIL